MAGSAKWLTAVAAVALLGSPMMVNEAGAATRAKAVVKRTKRAKKVVVRRPVARARVVVVQPVYSPVPVPVVGYQAPIPQAPALDYADYRWLDDADAMQEAVGQSPPDFRFDSNGTVRHAWLLRDGSLIVASPVQAEAVPRLYFFAADTSAPFLVRDNWYSYAFERGRLSALYDRSGRLQPIRGETANYQASVLYGYGRELGYAARTRPPLRSAQNLGQPSGFSFSFGYDGRDRWRDSEGLRAYRHGAGNDRGRQRDDRYRRERDERDGRATRPASGSGGSPYWSTPAATFPRPDVGGRPRQRTGFGAISRPTQQAPGVPPVASSMPVQQPTYVAPPAPVAEQPARFDRPQRMRDAVVGEAPVERSERRRAPEPPVASAPEPVARAPEPVPTPIIRQPEPEAPPPPRHEPEPAAAPPSQRAAPAPEPEAAPEPPPAPREPERTPTLRENEKPQ